jgi:hypothetical protein
LFEDRNVELGEQAKGFPVKLQIREQLRLVDRMHKPMNLPVRSLSVCPAVSVEVFFMRLIPLVWMPQKCHATIAAPF